MESLSKRILDLTSFSLKYSSKYALNSLKRRGQFPADFIKLRSAHT